ncbi:hypothetical protein [Spirosoma aerophilum]
MKNESWKFIFYEKQRLVKEAAPKEIPYVFGYISSKRDSHNPSLSINDLLHIDGKPYKVNKFDLNVFNCELHICLIPYNTLNHDY